MTLALLQEKVQGPHSMAQLQKWMDYLARSTDPEHVQACQEFKSVAVFKVRQGTSFGGPVSCLARCSSGFCCGSLSMSWPELVFWG